jgi:hypothetical protein
MGVKGLGRWCFGCSLWTNDFDQTPKFQTVQQLGIEVGNIIPYLIDHIEVHPIPELLKYSSGDGWCITLLFFILFLSRHYA